MPFRSGALSVRSYIVQDEMPAAFQRTATMAIRRYAYRPIDPERGEREAFGWVNPRDPLADQFVWEDLVDGNLVFLAVRRDRKTFNKVLYRARRERMFLDTKREKGVERLTRQHRIALEEQLTIQMLQEVTPTIAFTELVWDLNTGDVFIGATGKSLCERIADLFASTFDARLAARFPALTGYARIAEQGLEENFALATTALTESAAGEAE